MKHLFCISPFVFSGVFAKMFLKKNFDQFLDSFFASSTPPCKNTI